MPSLRRGMHSPECPLKEYSLPFSNEAIAEATADTARAVAHYAGFEEEVPVGDPELQQKASRCAQAILDGKCPLWEATSGGFVFKSK
ncbi:MAG: hypothetical protein U0520_02210 [Candidatus Saccharimonadales bacterium]